MVPAEIEYCNAQKDLLEALRFFTNTLLTDEELDIIEEFFQNSKSLSNQDKLLIPEVMKTCRKNEHISGDFLIALSGEEIMELQLKIYNARINNKYRKNKYKNHVQKIINEIGINNLYEIINELDGKSEENQ